MSEFIKELRIIDDNGRTLFDHDSLYVVPLYQRAYAWEEKEIIQLIHDICYMEQDEENYHLGSLIVAKNDNEFEVIDGQQRLTTLFILLKCLHEKGILNNDISNTLRFSCRDKSNYTLKNLCNLIDDDRVEENIRIGRGIILNEISKSDFSMDRFVELLKKVVLYRIEVPENTDLNRYFEIMNTRGEQLEQHDILKASLMSFLTDSTEKACFADIWDACSDMTGYVQMHFEPKVREAIFGSYWESLPRFENISELGKYKNHEYGSEIKISDIIKEDFRVDYFDGTDDNSDRIRFESIIEFPFFLLHVLKVFAKTRNIVSKDESILIDEMLDDKKLTRAFERVIDKGIMNDIPLSEQKEVFSRDFIRCMLQTRFLFDKYIVKREFVNEDSEGKWSIKELHISGRMSNKKAYYKNSDFGRTGEWENTREQRSRNNIMLQSCFRVSYTSPKIMHWITKLLIWLSENDFANLSNMVDYEQFSESVAKEAVLKDFINKCTNKCTDKCTEKCTERKYNFGVNTPHIVFNYLDYLLWKESKEEFTFEFRNSVEHWYPQHPSEGTFDKWTHEDGVDNFGNLCIIQRRENSKFSNMSPEAKKSTFEDMIKKGSLKLRRMAQLTVPYGDNSSSVNWQKHICQQHEDEMLSKLKTACENSSIQ